MITKNVYKTYALQIGQIFCEDSELGNLCVTSVKERIINGFNNSLFKDNFLPRINTARFYSLSISHAPSSEGFIKYNISGFDIVTGAYKTMMIDGIPGEKRDDIAWVFNQHLNEWYDSQGHPYHVEYLGKISERHILQMQTPNGYGIVFSPISAGGRGGKHIETEPTPQPTPPVMPAETPGLDVAGIFENPLLLIGGAALMFFYVMKN